MATATIVVATQFCDITQQMNTTMSAYTNSKLSLSAFNYRRKKEVINLCAFECKSNTKSNESSIVSAWKSIHVPFILWL